MFLSDAHMQIWLYTEPTDMRKQFDGLAALAKNKLQGQLHHDQLFVFINRKRTHIKALYYSQGGLCLWAKRLERGHFQSVVSGTDGSTKVNLSWAQLQCFIEGIEWQKKVKNTRFRQ